MTWGWDRKLLSMSCLPGHQMPDTPPQLGAAATNKIGLPVRVASARPVSQVANHGMPAAFAWGTSSAGFFGFLGGLSFGLNAPGGFPSGPPGRGPPSPPGGPPGPPGGP